MNPENQNPIIPQQPAESIPTPPQVGAKIEQIPTDPKLSSPPVIPEEPKFKNKILLAIIVLTVIGLSILVYWISRSYSGPTTKTPAVSTPSPQVSSDTPSNWKSYTNINYKYALLFPDSWEYCLSEGVVSWLVDPGKCEPPYSDYHLKIEILEDTDFISDYYGPGDPLAYSSSGRQTVQLGPHSFVKQAFKQTEAFTWNEKVIPPGNSVIFYDLYDEKNNRIIEFYTIGTNINESQVEQIISTFKYLDQAVTENWGTYKSDGQLDIPDSYYESFVNLKNDLPKSYSFEYPPSWEVVEFGSSQYKKTVNLGYQLYKSDPSITCGGNTGGGGPCQNTANILFRFGMTDPSVGYFDQSFWGESFPIDHKIKIDINGVEVVQAFPTADSLYPEVSLFNINGYQFYVRTEFFWNSQETQYSKETISEINQILSSIKFSQ